MATLTGGKTLTKRQIAAYMLLPQVWPRINGFYKEGFSHLSYMLALVYRGIGLLPPSHSLFLTERRSDLSLSKVLGAAGAELTFTRANIDKVIMYFVILLGLVLLACQFFLTVGYLLINPAFAQAEPRNYGDFFQTAQKGDLAYKMLFAVFGVPDLFNPGGSPSPFHKALHALFQLYSTGLLVVAAIIICYFIFAIFVETAQTGVPFGRRYNHVWAPIRLVFALGLLVPIGYGLNAGQWVVLYSAKFGSDFATKGWTLFSEKLSQKYMDPDVEKLVGTPQTPELTNLAAFMMVVNGCKYAYTSFYEGKKIEGYLVKPGDEGSQPVNLDDKNFSAAQDYFNKGDIVIRFGEHDPQKYSRQLGKVAPFCGELIIPSSDAREQGSLHIQEYYYGRVKQMLRGGYRLKEFGENYIKKYRTNNPEDAELPPPTFAKETREKLVQDTTKEIAEAVQKQNKSETWNADLPKIKEYGWAGAGIWYNKLAQVNGSLITAVGNIPQIRKEPGVLEYQKSKLLQQNFNLPSTDSPYLSDGRELQYETSIDKEIASLLNNIKKYWNDNDLSGPEANPTGNFFVDAINLIFGTSGLFNMCANVDVHPLGQLSMLGKGLMETSIRNLGAGYAFKLTSILGGGIGAALGALSSILISIATISMSLGFILYYVVPFLPFLYFFFAATGWIKGVFEAMVGVPLWALAHLRISGEGLQGDAARDGLYLIFEIFIRPILIIFGLLSSVIIFAAMVKVLNEIFHLVVTNLSGHDEQVKSLCGKSLQSSETGSGNTSALAYYRGPIDEFFFTVLYAIIVYMIGLSCFKLIDLVPNNILRYMGVGVHTFNDMAEDLAGGSLGKLAYASSSATDQVFGNQGVISSGIGGATQGAQGIASDLGRLGGR